MGRILDYPCRYGSEEVNIQPEAYVEHSAMALQAQEIRKNSGAAFCLLPFCHTLEAEALGAEIFLGDSKTGPRARNFSYEKLADLPRPLRMDLHTPRLLETVAACKLLQEQEEQVLFQISGPLTILGSLVSMESLFRSMKKEPDLFWSLLEELGKELLRFFRFLEGEGIRSFSYADPSGAVSILGPKLAEQIAKNFSKAFLQKADRELGQDSLFLLCPKTALALIGSELAQWQDHVLPEPMAYLKAADTLRGRGRFFGQSCIKKQEEISIIKELIWKEDQPC